MAADLAPTFAALAEPTRLAAVRLLRRRPLPSGEIARALSVSRPAMSRHLRVLRRAGLVEEDGLEADARVRVYRLSGQRLGELRRWLEELESFWQAQLRSFQDHVEGRGRR